MTRVPYPCPSCDAVFDSPKARASHTRKHNGPTLAARLAARTDFQGPYPADATLGRCWVWKGYTRPDGYGRMVVDGINKGVHVVALELALGRPVLPGHDASHRCDNPPCIRRSHMFEATHVGNVADRDAKGRAAAGAANGRARLTADDVAEIRLQLAERVAWSTIAADFGVSKGAIGAIATGRSWR